MEELLHRIWFLGAYGLRQARRALKLGSLFEVAVARAVVEAATLPAPDESSVLLAWFDQVAAHYGSAGSPRLTKRFGAFYKELFDPRWERSLLDVRQAFEGYVADRWAGQLAARNRRLSDELRDRHLWVPLTRAAKELRWKLPRLQLAVERGAARGHLVDHESGRKFGTIHVDDLARLREETRDEMTLLDVCARLHFGKRRVLALVASGDLVPISGPSIDGLTIWRFKRLEVEAAAESRPVPPLPKNRT